MPTSVETASATAIGVQAQPAIQLAPMDAQPAVQLAPMELPGVVLTLTEQQYEQALRAVLCVTAPEVAPEVVPPLAAGSFATFLQSATLAGATVQSSQYPGASGMVAPVLVPTSSPPQRQFNLLTLFGVVAINIAVWGFNLLWAAAAGWAMALVLTVVYGAGLVWIITTYFQQREPPKDGLGVPPTPDAAVQDAAAQSNQLIAELMWPIVPACVLVAGLIISLNTVPLTSTPDMGNWTGNVEYSGPISDSLPTFNLTEQVLLHGQSSCCSPKASLPPSPFGGETSSSAAESVWDHGTCCYYSYTPPPAPPPEDVPSVPPSIDPEKIDAEREDDLVRQHIISLCVAVIPYAAASIYLFNRYEYDSLWWNLYSAGLAIPLTVALCFNPHPDTWFRDFTKWTVFAWCILAFLYIAFLHLSNLYISRGPHAHAKTAAEPLRAGGWLGARWRLAPITAPLARRVEGYAVWLTEINSFVFFIDLFPVTRIFNDDNSYESTLEYIDDYETTMRRETNHLRNSSLEWAKWAAFLALNLLLCLYGAALGPRVSSAYLGVVGVLITLVKVADEVADLTVAADSMLGTQIRFAIVGAGGIGALFLGKAFNQRKADISVRFASWVGRSFFGDNKAALADRSYNHIPIEMNTDPASNIHDECTYTDGY